MANIVQRSPRLGDVARFNSFMDVGDWFNNYFGMRPFFREMEVAPQIKMDLT